MATATDLAGMLRNDPDNLLSKLSLGLVTERAKRIVVKLRFKANNASSEQFIGDEAGIIVDTPQPVGADNLVERIEREITGALGTAPVGIIRIRVHDEKLAAKPFIDMQRTLIPSDGNNSIGSAAYLRTEIESLRRQNAGQAQLLRDVVVQLVSSNTEKDRTISALGHMRGTANAANDLSGITTMVAGAALVFGWPKIKQALGIPQEASTDLVIAAIQARVLGIGKPPETSDAELLTHASQEEAPPPDRATGPSKMIEAVEAEPDPAARLRELLAQTKGDKVARAQLFAAAFDDPEVAAEAQTAFLAAMASGKV